MDDFQESVASVDDEFRGVKFFEAYLKERVLLQKLEL
jgi:hypothetical protein